MDVENTFIKPILLFHFGKGKTEIETYKQISNQYGPQAISIKTINKWFTIFKSEENGTRSRNSTGFEQKLTDKYLIDLINDNPELSMEELARLGDTSCATISRRLKFIKNAHGRVNYLKKNFKKFNNNKPPTPPKKFTDEFLINLINENPDLSMYKLAILANCSRSTILTRLNQINSDQERVKYTKKDYLMGAPKFTDEYLINLINNNPGLSIKELAKLTDSCTKTVSKRLKQINNNGELNHKIALQKGFSKVTGRIKKFSDEFLINLVNENPDLNMKELGRLVNSSSQCISKRLNQINSEGERVTYISKKNQNRITKHTDQFIIDLINQNPDLNTCELAKLANCSKSTILTRLSQINGEGERVKYINKNNLKHSTKFSDEYLINLINNNPSLNMKELGKLAGTSRDTISRRLNQINNNGERVKYTIKKVQNSFPKFTDEYLIDLINNNPELCMNELAKIANCSKSTIAKRLKQINRDGERVNYIKKSKAKIMKYT